MNRPIFLILTFYDIEALGARSLHTYLKACGADIRLLFYKDRIINDMYSLDNEDIRNLTGTIKDINPDFVGLSFVSAFFRSAVVLTEEIRKKLSVPVIWGGAHATVMPEESIEFADMICVGEGEEAALELYRRLVEENSPEEVGNIWYREGGTIVENPRRPLITDLDKLPFFDYGNDGKYFIDNENKLHEKEPFNIESGRGGFFHKRYYLQTSRGCPFRCNYCTNEFFRTLDVSGSGYVRQRGVDSVVAELHYALDRFPELERIAIRDEVFGTDREWLEKFCTRYSDEIGLPFQINMHPNIVSEDILRLLTEAGLTHLTMGIQSGSERIRKEVFNRPASSRKLLKAFELIHDAGLIPSYDIIVDNPWETMEDKEEALDFFIKIPHPYHFRVFSLSFLPQTIITTMALEEGKISRDYITGYSVSKSVTMRKSLDSYSDDGDLFWSSLISMLSKRFVPRRLIKLIFCSAVFHKYPKTVAYTAKALNIIKTGIIGIGMVVKGQIGWSYIRSQWKSAVRTVK